MVRCKEDSHTEIEIKKSKFITYLHRCFDEQDAKEYILKIKKEHPNATHHCYAMILGEHNEIQRNNDDGEPGGTAGVPMLECLLHHQLQDIVAVTVRYFGGIKLGAGGLVRAYSGAVSEAIKQAVLTKKQTMHQCTLTFSYDLIGKIDYFFRKEQYQILHQAYEEQVTYTFLCKEIPYEKLAEMSAGAYVPEFIQDVIVEVELTSPNENN